MSCECITFSTDLNLANSVLQSMYDNAKLKACSSWSILLAVAVVYILNTLSFLLYDLMSWAIFLFLYFI